MTIAQNFVSSAHCRNSHFQYLKEDVPTVVQFAATEAGVFAQACEMVAPYCHGYFLIFFSFLFSFFFFSVPFTCVIFYDCLIFSPFFSFFLSLFLELEWTSTLVVP